MSDFNPGQYGVRIRRLTAGSGLGGTTPVPTAADMAYGGHEGADVAAALDARPPTHVLASTDPTTGDDDGDGHVVGCRWINESSGEEFVAVDVATGAAVWESTTAGGGGGTVDIEDEGSAEGAADTIDFVGAGVSVGFSSGTATVTIPGGGGITGKVPVNVGSATQTSSASTLSVTISAAASGNLLIATISSIGTVNVSSIASTNTTWSVLQSSTASTSPKAEIWKGVVAGGSSGTTVTITLSGNSSDRSAIISEWNGITGTLDQSASRSGVAVSANGLITSTPVILPTDANALVVACLACTNGTVRFGQAGGGLVGFEPLVLGTGSMGGYQGAYYGFPGTVPVAAQAVGPTSGNYSGTIVSLT